MQRRAFLQLLSVGAAGAAVTALDPDLLRWVSGARTYFDIQRASGLWTREALKVGDIFSIDGVFALHPLTGREVRHPKRFTVTAAVSGAGPIPVELVYPRPIDRGIYANVSVDPYTGVRRYIMPTPRPRYTAPMTAQVLRG